MTTHHHISTADSALLDLLTSDKPLTAPLNSRKFARRDAALDPLLIAAAAASGPHMTRNHYAHDFFPGIQLPSTNGTMDFSRWSGQDASVAHEKQQQRSHAKMTYVSRQAPRRERLGLVESAADPVDLPSKHPGLKSEAMEPPSEPVEVKCMARTRIPTPHGPIFLHLYHNNRDNKEHLALVVDPVQLEESPPSAQLQIPPIRSASLEAVWSPSETESDRLLRGAYVGRLSPSSQTASRPDIRRRPSSCSDVPAPLIRIHSECFTGETIGSLRCDCGEQLDEAIRQIALPQSIPSLNTSIPGRGAVIYMRQEGRGIGLLSKIRAYNLQDMGHDTVSANLMLGHKADERRYDVAAAILRDLGLGDKHAEGVRMLTNNPDKLQALAKEDLKVVERVPMIPRSWQMRQQVKVAEPPETPPIELDHPGVTMIGGNAVHGPDLDKYLRTKVLRMGHILPLWLEGSVDA